MIQGQKIKITAYFRDQNAALADPTNVFFRYKVNSAAVTEEAYGAGQVLKSATGTYYIELDTTNYFGTLAFRWYSTGNIQTTHKQDTIEIERAEP